MIKHTIKELKEIAKDIAILQEQGALPVFYSHGELSDIICEQQKKINQIISDKWEDISTAPKDGTRILVSNGEDYGFGCFTDPYDVGVAYYNKECEQWVSPFCCDGVTFFSPILWTPLKKPLIEVK